MLYCVTTKVEPGFQCLAQEHINMWTGGAGDQTNNSVINREPTLPAESEPPH